MQHLQEHPEFTVQRHPEHPRLLLINISEAAATRFLEQHAEVSPQNLTFVPYMRFVVAENLQSILGMEFAEVVNAILHDRESGGFALTFPGSFRDEESLVVGATAVTHLLGIPNFDAMTGNFYAIFEVRHTDDSDSYLRNAYRTLTLHTDGTFVPEDTDWILMMKLEEEHARGGRARLLHLDDWKSLEEFASQPMAKAELRYRGPPSKNVAVPAHRRTFYEREGAHCIAFIDQFAYPREIPMARYLHDLSRSLEASDGLRHVSIPVGAMVVVNNHFWLHGREPFEEDPGLRRVLMRQRGEFRLA